MVKIYKNEGEIIGKEGDELANIKDVEFWTAMTGEVIDGVFEVREGCYQWIDLTFIDEYEFCGYVRTEI